jgi:hypothetical protein
MERVTMSYQLTVGIEKKECLSDIISYCKVTSYCKEGSP